MMGRLLGKLMKRTAPVFTKLTAYQSSPHPITVAEGRNVPIVEVPINYFKA
jgi:hypothetical protein